MVLWLEDGQVVDECARSASRPVMGVPGQHREGLAWPDQQQLSSFSNGI